MLSLADTVGDTVANNLLRPSATAGGHCQSAAETRAGFSSRPRTPPVPAGRPEGLTPTVLGESSRRTSQHVDGTYLSLAAPTAFSSCQFGGLRTARLNFASPLPSAAMPKSEFPSVIRAAANRATHQALAPAPVCSPNSSATRSRQLGSLCDTRGIVRVVRAKSCHSTPASPMRTSSRRLSLALAATRRVRFALGRGPAEPVSQLRQLRLLFGRLRGVTTRRR